MRVDEYRNTTPMSVDNSVDDWGTGVECVFPIPIRCGHGWGQTVQRVDDEPIGARFVHRPSPLIPITPPTYQRAMGNERAPATTTRNRWTPHGFGSRLMLRGA